MAEIENQESEEISISTKWFNIEEDCGYENVYHPLCAERVYGFLRGGGGDNEPEWYEYIFQWLFVSRIWFYN